MIGSNAKSMQNTQTTERERYWDERCVERIEKKTLIQRSVVQEGCIGMVDSGLLMRSIVTFNYSKMKYFPNVWKSNALPWTIFQNMCIDFIILLHTLDAFDTNMDSCYAMQWPSVWLSLLSLSLSTQPMPLFPKIISCRVYSKWHLYFSTTF